LVPLLIFGAVHFEGARIGKEAQADLDAIARLKVGQIEQWLAERHSNATVLMASQGFIEALERWFRTGDGDAKARVDERLGAMMHAVGYRVELLDAMARPGDPVRQAQLAAALSTRQVQVTELYRDSRGGVWLDFVVPLLKHAPDAPAVGAVVLRAPAGQFLFPLIQTWPTASPSAETLLVRREGNSVLFLNDLRHRKNTALTFRLPLDASNLPAAIAVRSGGKPQVIAGRDYRGTQVLAAVRPVPGTSWFLVSKVDQDEVLGPLHELVAWVSVVSLAAIAALAAVVTLLWRQQQRAHQLELLARTGEAVRDSEQRLAGLVDSAMDAIIAIDESQRIVLFNPSAERMFGLGASQALGRPLDQLLPQAYRQPHAEHIQDFGRTGITSRSMGSLGALSGLRANGEEFPIEASISQSELQSGKIYTVILRDITERKQTEEALRTSQADLNRAQAVGHIGSWRLDVRSNQLTWSEENHRIFEVPEGTLMTYEFFLSTVHPDDRAYVDREWQAGLRGEPYDIEHRILVNGKLKWVREKAELDFDAQGKLLGGFGTTQDISERKESEELLRASEARFRAIFEVSSVGMCQAAPLSGKLLNVNRRFCEMTGYSEEELVNRPFSELTYPEDRPRSVEQFSRLVRGEIPEYRDEKRYVCKDGRVIWADVTVNLIRDLNLNPLRTIAVIQDITERKQAEETLLASEEKFRSLVEQASDGIFVSDAQGHYTEVNSAGCGMLGYTRDELLHLSIADVIAPQEIPRIAPEVARFADGKVVTSEWLFLRKDGSFFPGEVSGRQLPDGRLQAILRDITERKTAEQALRYQLHLTQSIADKATDSIFVNDAEGRVTFANPEAERVFGYRAEELIGRRLHEVVHHTTPDGQPYPMGECPLCRVYLTGETIRNREAVFFHKGGAPVYVTASNAALESEGRRVGAALVLHDVTQSKAAEVALSKSQRQLRLFIEQAPISIAMLDRNMKYIATSRRWIAEYGSGYDDLTGRSYYEVHPDVSDKWRKVHRDALAGATLENDDDHWVQADGTEYWLRWAVHPWTDETGKIGGIIISAEDITERKAAEIALREREDDLNRAQAVGHIGSWRLDVQHNELKWSAETYRIFGIAEATPLSYETFLSCVHPDDREYVDAMWESGLSGEPYDIEHRIVVDAKVKWVREKAKLEVDEKNELIGAFGTTQDVTERKQAELALQEANQRKDEFLALLAHELRNPMAVATTAVYLLQTKGLTDPETCRWATATISSQTDHLKRLVDDLLDVARIGRGKIALQKVQLDLVQLIGKVEQACRPLLDRRQQHFKHRLPSVPLWVEADSARLTQIITNLLDNAIKFTPANGQIELSLQAEGNEAVIRVRDTGRGIASELLPGIFDTFTQGEVPLARDEGGLGLGLALVKKLTEYHGGSVSAASAGRGKGAEFTVRLPALAEPRAVMPASYKAKTGKVVERRILIAEDNATASEAMAKVLRHAGHSVRLAQDGTAALAAAKAELPEIAIFDIGLPAMDGFELARNMRSLPDGNQVLLIALTGYGQAKYYNQSRSAGFDYHIVKPADIDQLLGIINAWKPPVQA
jgi:PAS domain S-box-containing protein